jgi:choline kinase
MTAIILAADRASVPALVSPGPPHPLLHVGGRAVLSWMLEHLRTLAVPLAIVVAGAADIRQIRAVVAQARRNLRVQVVEGPDPGQGTAMALHRVRDVLGAGPTLLLTGGVLCPREVVRRLVEAPAANALVFDRGLAQSGDSTRIYTRADRVVAVGRSAPARWDAVGTSVGLAKLGASAGLDLAGLLEQGASGQDAPIAYEAVLHRLASHRLIRAVDVAGLPWADVGHPDGRRRAEQAVAARIGPLDGAA